MEHLNSSNVLSFHILFTFTCARPNPGAHFAIDPCSSLRTHLLEASGCPPPREEPFPRVCCTRVLGWDKTSHTAPPGASICTFPNLRKVFVHASSRSQHSLFGGGLPGPWWESLFQVVIFTRLESPASLQPPGNRLLWASLLAASVHQGISM